MAVFDYLVEEGIEVGSLVFDGLIIYNDRLPKVLEGYSRRVKDVVGEMDDRLWHPNQ